MYEITINEKYVLLLYYFYLKVLVTWGSAWSMERGRKEGGWLVRKKKEGGSNGIGIL